MRMPVTILKTGDTPALNMVRHKDDQWAQSCACRSPDFVASTAIAPVSPHIRKRKPDPDIAELAPQVCRLRRRAAVLEAHSEVAWTVTRDNDLNGQSLQKQGGLGSQ